MEYAMSLRPKSIHQICKDSMLDEIKYTQSL